MANQIQLQAAQTGRLPTVNHRICVFLVSLCVHLCLELLKGYVSCFLLNGLHWFLYKGVFCFSERLVVIVLQRYKVLYFIFVLRLKESSSVSQGQWQSFVLCVKLCESIEAKRSSSKKQSGKAEMEGPLERNSKVKRQGPHQDWTLRFRLH